MTTISRQRKWQIKNKENGMCVICGKEKMFKAERCWNHYQPYLVKNKKKEGK